MSNSVAGPTQIPAAERAYRLLLRALPHRFRRAAEPEMLAIFRDWHTDVRSGRLGRLRFWRLVVSDLARCLRAELTSPAHTPPRVQDRSPMIELLFKDVRQAVRGLGRAPGMTLVIVLTLALAIGANTAIFSVVDGILLRPLAMDEPEHLVAIWADMTERGGPHREWLSFPNHHDLAELPGVFAEASTYLGWGGTLAGSGEPTSFVGAQISEGMFNRVLRVQPALGRAFSPADDVPGAERVALLSWSLWQQHWNGDPGILGESVLVNESPIVVIGVMPENFRPPFAPQAQAWTPLQMNATDFAGARGSAMYRSIGRLEPGVALDAAQAAADVLGDNLEAEFPGANTGVGYTLRPLQTDLVGTAQPMLWVLLGAVGAVLLIACVNIANLLLAHASARAGEVAVRSALGASRAGIVRQLLLESMSLAAIGGTLGAVLGFYGTSALVALAPAGTPRLDEVTVDMRVFAFTVMISAGAAILFGLIPALRLARTEIATALGDAGRSADGSSGGRLRAGLVVTQVALAMVLLIGAGLLLRTFQELQRVDLGFAPDNVLTLQLGLPGTRYAEPIERIAFYDELTDRLTALPGVTHVGAVNSLPLTGQNGDANFQIDGQPAPPAGQERIAWIRRITHGYAETMGLRLVAGRFPDARDDAEAPTVVAINETLADRYFPDTNPVGQRLYFGQLAEDTTFRTIVGVVGDLKQFSVAGEDRNAIYFPYPQSPSSFLSIVVRTTGDPAELAGPVRGAIAELDPLLAARNIDTMDDVISQSLAPERFVALLVGIFAAVALMLAAVGLYGVVNYAVSSRTHEMGVRLALGARGAEIRRLVVGRSAMLIGAGLVLGLVGAWGAGRGIAQLLYGVAPTDPATLAGVVALLVAAGLIAAVLPARRASRIDPIRVLGRD